MINQIFCGHSYMYTNYTYSCHVNEYFVVKFTSTLIIDVPTYLIN